MVAIFSPLGIFEKSSRCRFQCGLHYVRHKFIVLLDSVIIKVSLSHDKVFWGSAGMEINYET